jgi:hypothetical protein
MGKSFSVTNKQSYKSGNVHTHSSATSDGAITKSFADTNLNVPVVKDDKSNSKTALVKETASIADVVSSIGKGQSVTIPAMTKIANDVPSSTKKGKKTSVNVGSSNQTAVPKAQAKIANVTNAATLVFNDERVDVSNETFSPAEKITGLSQERPEVIQMMNYLPLFDETVGAAGYNTSDPKIGVQQGYESTSDYGFTPAGEFFDTTYKMRLMKIANANKTQFFFKGVLNKKDEAFTNAITDVETILRVMFSTTQIGNSLKRTLGIRDIKCNFQTALQRITQAELREISDPKDKDLTRYDSVMTPSTLSPMVANGTFTVPGALATLGFSLDVSNNVFSSTKLWMQLLYELRVILKHSSDKMLNVQTQMQQVDVDPLVVNKHTASLKRLGSRPIVVSPYGSRSTLPVYNDVISLTGIRDGSSLISYVEMLLDAYSKLYSNVSFDGLESKISALTNCLSQEYRYSYALKQLSFRNLLQRDYGYTVVLPGDDGSNNVEFIDAVIGKIPDKVTDVIVGNADKSLVSVSQQTVNNVAILPLETRYIEVDSSTITPGGVFYVDSSLSTTDGKQFNTGPLQSYYNTVSNALKHFIPISLACNMYMFDSLKSSVSTDDVGWPTVADPMFSDARVLFSKLVKMLSDNDSENLGTNATFDGFGKKGWHDDPTWSLFSYATKNPRVLALLFTFVSSRMSTMMSWVNTSLPSSSDKKLLLDNLIDEIERDFVITTQPAVQNFGDSTSAQVSSAKKTQGMNVPGVISSDVFLNEDALRSKLQDNGGVIDFVATIMLKLTMILGRLLDIAPRSQYSGMPSTLLNMLVFELMCLIIDSYGNVHLDHVSNANNNNIAKRTFCVRVKSSQIDTSMTNVYTRLEVERAHAQGLLLSTTAVLAEIGFGLKTYLTLLLPDTNTSTFATNSYSSLGVQALRSITQLLKDPMYTNLLLSEQQLMTALNGVYDIKTQVDRTTNADVAYSIIDDAADDPDHTVLLDTLYSVLNDKAFRSVSGYNKRIITVGLPTGFTHKFKQRKSNGSKNVNDTGSVEFTNKINDVIRVVVRKIDVRYNEVIFKPISFLFDLSRYPARTARLIKNDVNVTLANVAAHLGTRDYGNIETLSTSPLTVEYYAPGAYTLTDVPANSTESYVFLTNAQRAEVYRNHVLSYLFEVYVRIMTGMNVSENAFTFRMDTDPIFTAEKATGLLQNLISTVTSNSKKNSSVTPITIFPNMNKSFQKPMSLPNLNGSGQNTMSLLNESVSSHNKSGILETCKQASTFLNLFSVSSNDVYAKQRMLLPKQFDRIFNVMIDPDDFEVDIAETNKTILGKQVLDSLVHQGEMIVPDVQTTSNSSNTTIHYVGRQRTASDVTFEKYIINVESFDEDGV